ncbi:transmembrane protein, putative (macronuclear) [Tetrahymena thermophila SB210]|uniref:Transmembrane protein, putative n=1 Tax=Tetrahymena thermophila (strain SB210) TaxID=312017 RepID=W7XB77_TETTS|nr:transmembrane protein, putative [Tetrahymena thermophila SB210]EWS76635.1 transmembrane protein, putative [Tetrahymena thermophila SB210]|eukprot:XP_012650803.1 transmembrane protein, putative [Tetrahymena thermophila SB210]
MYQTQFIQLQNNEKQLLLSLMDVLQNYILPTAQVSGIQDKKGQANSQMQVFEDESKEQLLDQMLHSYTHSPSMIKLLYRMGSKSIQASINSIQQMSSLSKIQKRKKCIPCFSFHIFHQGKIRHNYSYPDQNKMGIYIQGTQSFYRQSNLSIPGYINQHHLVDQNKGKLYLVLSEQLSKSSTSSTFKYFLVCLFVLSFVINILIQQFYQDKQINSNTMRKINNFLNYKNKILLIQKIKMLCFICQRIRYIFKQELFHNYYQKIITINSKYHRLKIQTPPTITKHSISKFIVMRECAKSVSIITEFLQFNFELILCKQQGKGLFYPPMPINAPIVYSLLNIFQNCKVLYFCYLKAWQIFLNQFNFFLLNSTLQQIKNSLKLISLMNSKINKKFYCAGSCQFDYSQIGFRFFVNRKLYCFLNKESYQQPIEKEKFKMQNNFNHFIFLILRNEIQNYKIIF